MTTFKNLSFSLLLVSIFVTSCNGQTKKAQPNQAVVEQISFTSKNTKLTKPMGQTNIKMCTVLLRIKLATFGSEQRVKAFTGMMEKN